MIRLSNKNNGFTIVEILIVIVVIGILAAIVIVAFNGVRDSAARAAIKNDLVQVAKKLEVFRSQSTSDRYPVSAAELEAAGLKFSQGNYRVTNADGTARNNVYYTVTGITGSETHGKGYAIGTLARDGSISCLVNGIVSTAACSGGDNTRRLITTLPAPSDLSDTSWPATGHMSTTGWQAWTE